MVVAVEDICGRVSVFVFVVDVLWRGEKEVV